MHTQRARDSLVRRGANCPPGVFLRCSAKRDHHGSVSDQSLTTIYRLTVVVDHWRHELTPGRLRDVLLLGRPASTDAHITTVADAGSLSRFRHLPCPVVVRCVDAGTQASQPRSKPQTVQRCCWSGER